MDRSKTLKQVYLKNLNAGIQVPLYGRLQGHLLSEGIPLVTNTESPIRSKEISKDSMTIGYWSLKGILHN